MTTTDINTYLGGFGIPNDGTTVASSKWVYVKEMMSNVDDVLVLQIARELGINTPKSESLGSIKLAELRDASISEEPGVVIPHARILRQTHYRSVRGL